MQNKEEQRKQMMLMISDWQGSGLNQRAYCIANKVRYHVFHYWYRVHRSKQTTDTGSFSPVKVVSPVSKEQITIVGASGIKVQLPLTVVANPPFSLDKWGKVEDKEGDKTTISHDPETDKYNRFWRGVPPKCKGDWAFISHMIETLNEQGKAGIEHIVNTYRDFAAGKLQSGVVEDKYSYIATTEEIQENDFNLNIPRYVDTFEEEAEVDIVAVQTEIDSLEKDLAKVQNEIKMHRI